MPKTSNNRKYSRNHIDQNNSLYDNLIISPFRIIHKADKQQDEMGKEVSDTLPAIEALKMEVEEDALFTEIENGINRKGNANKEPDKITVMNPEKQGVKKTEYK